MNAAYSKDKHDIVRVLGLQINAAPFECRNDTFGYVVTNVNEGVKPYGMPLKAVFTKYSYEKKFGTPRLDRADALDQMDDVQMFYGGVKRFMCVLYYKRGTFDKNRMWHCIQDVGRNRWLVRGCDCKLKYLLRELDGRHSVAIEFSCENPKRKGEVHKDSVTLTVDTNMLLWLRKWFKANFLISKDGSVFELAS